MSADDIKASLPVLRLNVVKRAKLADLIDRRAFKEAAQLKAELDGPLPRGQIVPLRSAKRKLRAVPAADAGVHR